MQSDSYSHTFWRNMLAPPSQTLLNLYPTTFEKKVFSIHNLYPTTFQKAVFFHSHQHVHCKPSIYNAKLLGMQLPKSKAIHPYIQSVWCNLKLMHQHNVCNCWLTKERSCQWYLAACVCSISLYHRELNRQIIYIRLFSVYFQIIICGLGHWLCDIHCTLSFCLSFRSLWVFQPF